MDTTKIENAKPELIAVLEKMGFKETIIIGNDGNSIKLITVPSDELFQTIEMQRAVILSHVVVTRITGQKAKFKQV